MAANFATTMESLAQAYAQQHGVSSQISSGSSGKHYAQIRQGAPFDLFFSADNRRTADLEREGHTVAGSRQIYALGRLVLWSPDPAKIPADGAALLAAQDYRRLAMANPRVAPYGASAEALMNALNLDLPRGRVVVGQSLGQTMNFLVSGNAEIGFIALSQARIYEREHGKGSSWLPAEELYPPIIQEAVVPRTSRQQDAAQKLLAWMRDDPVAQAIITEDGYRLPQQ
ncbi:molybdate ABC transporter substrate-binding protein [Alkalilimnicola ehrlichii]|uniref:Molybdate ABC transporter substrate-binding protein n=1 Tax=Alkalilimnicola ehrlichii TaxID=351052 RepID=A0A3E0X016_9GAMM|nr:molybdate ABC transporter substrate-binding protein [Alkalilimnicola ehrlichii]RFA37959.1 molybdate ABC transporter substrate-binding protein [Alkalilimnicola ehrlichii]